MSQEQLDSLVQLSPLVDEPEKVYVPMETIRYVFPDTPMGVPMVIDEKTDATPEELVSGSLPDNVMTVTSPTDFTNSIVEYDFFDGKIYEIFTSPNRVTDLRLAPGEAMTGDTAIGDSTRWQFAATSSQEYGQPVQHLFIRPSVAGIDTTMIIPTNYRTYYLQLRSYEDLYMVGVRWRYPQVFTFAADGTAQNVQQVSEGLVSAADIDFGYQISGNNQISWKPTAVYSDGIHTYFQMDPRFSTTAGAPALYLLPDKGSSSEKNLEVINYRVKGNLYIADFVLTGKQAFMFMAFKNDSKVDKVIISRR